MTECSPVFDDSLSYGIARAILLRRSVTEHTVQRCVTTLCGQAPACTVPRQHRVVSYHPKWVDINFYIFTLSQNQ